MSVQIAPEHAVETPRRASANSSVLNATGYVVAQRQAAVSSKATGRLKELRVKEGDRVAENEIIGVLENDDLLHIIAKEKAALEAAKARVAYAEAELAVAEIELKRVLPLAEQRAVSQSEKDAAEARYRRAVADLAAQRAGVALAEAGVKEAEVNFEYTLILSPFAGTVLTKNADIGEIVAPYGTSSDARAAVVTIADMESLQVEADV
ncbi:MAG TPA: efflux RND transporter periplasmic adaptor subunit, partial [Oligoflexia bacterium]|nr:efflux RND transporter periplasmic adaptor subunit [Oligoflexia bacterium]